MGLKEDVEQFENKLTKLKVDYEQYFMKVVRREPAKLRDEMDKFVLNYSNKSITNTQYKFRLNAAVAKYNAYKQYWNRVLRDIEEGKFMHRAEGGFALPAANNNNHLSGGQPTDLTEPEELEDAAPQPHEAPKPAPPPKAEARDETEEVYRKFIEARRQCGEPTEGITKDSLSKSIEQSKKLIADKYKTFDVELKVLIKDGKAKLTIVPKKTS